METYRIGEVADRACVSVAAVRYYERLGLVAKAPRTSTGIRRYPPETIERIKFVKQAQAHGFTLGEIRELISLKSRGGSRRCRQVQQFISAKIAHIDEQVTQLREFRQTLRGLADECAESLTRAPDPECPVIAKL